VIDDDRNDEGATDTGTIGVGMGGSCPTCRAPVDLGQEFCLECGAPIRFTPKQRQRPRGARRTAASGSAPPGKGRGGFPWIPILVMVALIGGGVAFALVDGDSGGSDDARGTDTAEPALPTITNQAPTATTDSSTRTIALEGCDPSRPLDGTQPAIDDRPDERIPQFDDGNPAGSGGGFDDVDDGFDDPSSRDVPSIEPIDPGFGTTITVDENGNLCPDDAGGGTGDTGSGGLDGSDDAEPGTTGTSGDWPSGRNGWTVIVAGYPGDEARAQQRAADVQEDGFTDSGVLFSSDFTSLCPGFHVVYSGVFTSQSSAQARQRELAARPDYAGMYVREIRTDGPAATGCSTTSR
jgi:hypothetical protein